MLPLFLKKLGRGDGLQWEMVHHEEIPGSPLHHQEIPPRLHPRVAELIRASGIQSLYSHQAEAVRLALAGCNVVLATSTASGKTLAYQASVMDRLIRDEKAQSLFVFPLKALERDQRDAFLALAGSAGLTAAVYDGDTPEAERRKIRRVPPRVLITNPDMLHLGLLAYHASWKEFFANLCYVVLDEVHTYKGIFGSHISQVLLRMRRVCQLYGSRPHFFASSATVSNPGAFVSSLIGEETSVVDHSGASSPKRHFIFLKPILSPYTVAARLFVQGVESGLKTIAFTRARKITELITMWVTMEAPQLRNRVSSYRAGFTSEERRKIEARLFSGEMDGVISTSALEMGIDVGGLDLCLLVGYPGTIINTWQRGGRVGRGGRESAIVLIAGNDALDHYFLKHPDDFFGRNCERAVLDPLNIEVLKRHIPCAAAEAPIRAEEEWTGQPEVRSALEEMEEAGTIYRTSEDDSWHAYDRRPHRGVDLRGIGESFSIFLEDGKTLIGSSSGGRVFTECHEGAVYLHRARQYLVTKLDLERRNIVVKRETLNYYTRGLSEKDTEILGAPLNSREFPGFVVREGRLKVTEHAVAYEKRRTSSQELIGIVDLDLPPIHFETFGFWVEIPDRVKKAVQAAQLNFMGGIHALEHAAIAMFPLFALCDRDDVGGISTPQHQQVCRAAVFIYDGHPGGVGLAHHVFGLIEELLQKTRSLVGECQCEDGCPSCIHSPKCGSGNQPLDKKACLAVLQCLIDPEKGFTDLGEMKSKQKPMPRLVVPGHEMAIHTNAPPRNQHVKPPVGARHASPERAASRLNAGSSLASTIPQPQFGSKRNLTENSYQKSGQMPKPVIFPDLRQGMEKQHTSTVGEGIDPYPISKHQGHAEVISRPKEIEMHVDHNTEAEVGARGQATVVLPAAMPPRLVVFDLETRKLADEVGGWQNIPAMGLSLAVAYSKEKGFLTFTEDNVSELIDLLKEADLVVGFNHVRFDYAVLKAYSAENLKALPNLDICTEVSGTLGFRLSLDHLARFTLEKGKSGDGLDAVRWFREGRMDLLEEYCREDVIITRDLYLFGLCNGYLNYGRKNGRVAQIPVEWQGRGRNVRSIGHRQEDR